MGYLLPADYAAFGLDEETADAWVTAASAMMEAHCRRPSLGVASYTERMRVGRRGNSVRLSYGPVVSVQTVQARYAPLRREAWAEGECGFGLEVALTFGMPGAWVNVDMSTVYVDTNTGEICLPENVLLPRYSEVEVTYTAGLAVVPDAVKVACAQIVRNAQATPGLNVKSSKLDTLQMQYFSDSLLDSQVLALLRPYVAERLA